MTSGMLQNYINDTAADGSPKYMQHDGVVKKVWSQKKLYEKAIQFTFTGANGVDSVFQFSLPPQNIEIAFPQRISEVKTFGGSIIEDYGNDTLSISIQGTTANSDIRYYIYGQETTGSGFDEVTSFKKLLQDYGTTDELRKKKVQMYYGDFSCRVLVKSFSIKQTKDNPLSLTYTIELIGFDDDRKLKETSKIETVEKISIKEQKQYLPLLSVNLKVAFITQQFVDFTGVPNIDVYAKPEEAEKVLLAEGTSEEESYDKAGITEETVPEERFPAILNALEAGLQPFEAFRDICANIRGAIIRAGSALRNLGNQLYAYVDAVTSSIDEITSLGDFIITQAIRLGAGVVDGVLNAYNDLVTSIDGFVRFFTDFGDRYGQMTSDIIERWQKTSDEIVETLKYIGVSSKQKAEMIRAEVQQTISTRGIAVMPGDSTTDDYLVPTYGYTPRTLTASDTWDSIAQEVYGDASLGLLLSTCNSNLVQSPDTGSETAATPGMPPVGTEINIPVLQMNKGFDGTNEVYNLPGIVDNYGQDIGINSDGSLNIVGGDLGTTKSSDTLEQAVLNRLSTAIGSRIRTEVYGIRANIGDSDNTIPIVIASSIEATLLADPRVKSIDNVDFTGRGDNLKVEVSYTDINDRQSVVGGTF